MPATRGYCHRYCAGILPGWARDCRSPLVAWRIESVWLLALLGGGVWFLAAEFPQLHYWTV
jgi:hypothetical protein